MRISSMAAIAALVLAQPAAAQQANNAGLRIVVVEGEDAVNIIQQKTAVAPIVEVRDRNNLPVSGATVTFSIGQGASFGGQSTLTVVTNAAGQATATGLTPTAAGAIQIQATATFQGQTAIASIAQSNVMTAAEVATTTSAGAGGSGGGTGGGSTAAAGGGGVGGGLSATTIGIIGGAVAGGALVATQAGGGGSDSPGGTSTTTPGTSTTNPTTPTTQQPTSSSFAGPMDGAMTGTSTWTGDDLPNTSCSLTIRYTGSATLRTQTGPGGAITGTLEMNGRQNVSSQTCSGGFNIPIPESPFQWSAPVEGSGNTVRFTHEIRDSQSFPEGSFTAVHTIAFTGTISGGVVTGALTFNTTSDWRGQGFTGNARYTGTINVSLR